MPHRIFYGWYVVGAIGVVLTTTSGLGFYNLSVLLDAFVRERSFPVALASGATACYFVGSGVGGVIAGWLIDRVDPRTVVIVSAVVNALLLVGLGFIYAPVQLYLFHLLFGLCYGCGGIIPNITTVARWFEARRSLAISIASTGLSLGGIVITPASALLIERHGVAGAAPWLALTLLIGVVPVTAFVVRTSPQAMGLVPDGVVPAPGAAPVAAAPRATFAEARRSRFFAGVAASYFFVMGAQVGAIAHIYRLVKIGGGADIAALAVALLAGASVCGRRAGARHGQHPDDAAAAARRSLRHAELRPHLCGEQSHQRARRRRRTGAARHRVYGDRRLCRAICSGGRGLAARHRDSFVRQPAAPGWLILICDEPSPGAPLISQGKIGFVW